LSKHGGKEFAEVGDGTRDAAASWVTYWMVLGAVWAVGIALDGWLRMQAGLGGLAPRWLTLGLSLQAINNNRE